MKNLFLPLFILIVLFANAQTGIIYNFAFRIDDELVTQMKSQNKDKKILNLATVEDMPKELSDTLMLVSEKMLSEFLNATVSSIKPDDGLITGALPQHLMYLPANTYKKAEKEAGDNTYFIDINCHIAASGGAKITLANNKFSKVKPKLTLRLKVYEKGKREFVSKTIELLDFKDLRSHTFEETYGIRGLIQNTDVTTVSETLNSDDVLRMYMIALSEVVR
ncbi:MAG: hypothetical protein ACK5B6_07415 [Bacteroidia bacterium]|jgi:hypothetical protein